MSLLEIVVFLICGGTAWAFFRVFRRPMQRRTVSESKIVRTQLVEETAHGPMSAFDRWFARAIRLGRVPWGPTNVALMIGAGTIVTAASVLLMTDRVLLAFWASVIFIAVSLAGLQIAFVRMVANFERQLPFALDLMARAVMAGESLDQAIRTVSESMEEPAKTEFKQCHNQLAMGLSVRAAMASLVGRVDTLNVRIMSGILSVHRENGGNLAETLQRLAEVIRKRFDYERRLRMVTGAGRVSLLIVVVLALGLFAYLFIARPEYGSQFFESSSGRNMLIFAGVLEVIGVAWGWLLVKSKY